MPPAWFQGFQPRSANPCSARQAVSTQHLPAPSWRWLGTAGRHRAAAGTARHAVKERAEKPAVEAADNSHDASGLPSLLWWDAASCRLVWLATPALLADTTLRAAVQAAAGSSLLASAAWVPLASNLTSYLILSTTFAADGERGAFVCYLTGLACTLGLLAQAHWLHAVPSAVFWPALLLAAGSAGASGAKLAGALETPAGSAAWRLWRGVVGCVGWAMLPQVAYLSLAVPPAAACTASWGPAAVSTAGAAALLAVTTAGVLPASWQRSWDVASWTATLLFMLEPLAALAAAAQDPTSLLALSPASFVLPALATGLQVRGRCCGTICGLTGTSWATLFACVQAALVAAAHGKLALAAGTMAAPLVCGASLLQGVATAQGHGAPLQALASPAAAYRREARLWRHLAARLRRRRHQTSRDHLGVLLVTNLVTICVTCG
ncbi:hypothetical protein ABPG77_004977 [Micractinium sp. CCAP 211/92]